MSSKAQINKNFLVPISFKFSIDNQELAGIEYYSVEAQIPSISGNSITTNYRGSQGSFPADQLTYDPLTIKFMVDEGLENYQEIYNWLVQNSGEQSGGDEKKIIQRDLILTTMTGKQNPKKLIRFVNAFPTSLGAIQFNVQNTDIEYASCDVVFAYSRFEFMK